MRVQRKEQGEKDLNVKKPEDINDPSVSINNNIIYKYHFKIMTL